MSQNSKEPDASLSGGNRSSTTRSLLQMIAFNLGLAVVLADGFWHLWNGPSETSAQHAIHALLFYFGLGLSIVTWIASSTLARGIKALLIVASVVVALAAGFESVRQYDIAEQVSRRGTVENGRVVYRGLGLSFAAPPNWQLDLQPFINNQPESGRKLPERRIRYGETIVFFRAYPRFSPKETEPVKDSIQIEGGPFLFRSLGRTMGSIRKSETSYRKLAGVRIIEPTRFFQIDNLDFAEFEVMDDTNQVLYRHVFARSGENRLDFVLTAENEQARPRFDEFIRSIRIDRNPTRFND